MGGLLQNFVRPQSCLPVRAAPLVGVLPDGKAPALLRTSSEYV